MLRRAALLIGVRKTGGGLPVLRGVGPGIESMRLWAEGQRDHGMEQIIVISDANTTDGSAVDEEEASLVTVEEIRRTVTLLVDGGAEQLYVYFAGHGANVRYNELWLLSGAPEAANEAVNLDGSVKLARQCGAAHVVIISDACRTAAASIQAQTVEGSVIFPNRPPAGRPGQVDVFYATVVSRPALEVSTSNAAENFVAVYTKSLAEGLNGKAPSEHQNDGGRSVLVIRPWPLQRFLEESVPGELTALGAPLSADQTPDAVITSPPESWVSQLPETPKGARTRAERAGRTAALTRDRRQPPNSLRSAAQDALSDALRGSVRRIGRTRDVTTISGSELLLNEYVTRVTQGQSRMEPPARGFVIRGQAVVEVHTAGVPFEQVGHSLVHVLASNGPSSVLLLFENGRGALVPTLPNFVATLTFDDDELADVVYDLAPGAPPTDVTNALIALLPLRDVAAAASRLGVFRLEKAKDSKRIARRLQAAKWLDLSLDLYAAYALASVGEDKMVEEVLQGVRDELGTSLFDLELLSRQPGKGAQPMEKEVVPPVPMLARGWALLDAHGVTLPRRLEGIGKHVTDSLWTLFDQEGVERVHQALMQGEIR